MADYAIQSFMLPVQEPDNASVIAAVNDWVAQLAKVQDDTPKNIFQYTGLVGQTPGSVYPGRSPYAIVKIEDIKEIPANASGLIIEYLVELSIALIFTSSPTDSKGNDSAIQKWGIALRERANEYLVDARENAPKGFDFDHPNWQFSSDTNYKAKLDRNVAALTGGEEQLKDTLFRVYIQKKIRVFPKTGL